MTALKSKKVSDVEQGQFGKAVQEAMEKKGWSMGDLASATDSTYEHTRKLIKSMAFPSKYMLKEVCKALSLNYDEMNQLVTIDKLANKYGPAAAKLYGSSDRVEKIKRDVDNMSDVQFNMLQDMIKSIKRQSV